MERQIFFLILILGGIWIILDDIYGKKHLEKFIIRLEGGK